jgi:hypothetical protein
MQPLLCKGGYPLPIGKGKKEIYGVVAAVNDTASASRLTLRDSNDFNVTPSAVNLKGIFADIKGLANADGVIGLMFSEPIKVIDGVCITSASTNLLPGRTFLYVR